MQFDFQEKEEGLTPFRKRLLFAFGGVLVLFLVLVARFAWLQILNRDAYVERAERNRTVTVTTQGSRGLIFDRNGLSYGSAISHASNSAAFTINTPGVYMTSFQGVINPASGVNFPLSITLTLQQGGSGVPGGGVLHTFHTSADAAVLPIAVPVAVTSAPSTLQLVGTGGSFQYSGITMTISRLGDIPTA